MNLSKFFAVIFAALGLCAMALGIYLAAANIDASPVLLEQPQAAKTQVNVMLDAICERDYMAVSGALYGTPELGITGEPDSQVGKLLWEAFAASFSYRLEGTLYVTDSGVAQNAVITALDLSSVTEHLRDRSQALLEERVRAAADPSEIYDENNEYREAFVMGVLLDAAEQALAEDGRMADKRVTLNLIYENGQWWIMPDSALLDAISGGMLK